MGNIYLGDQPLSGLYFPISNSVPTNGNVLQIVSSSYTNGATWPVIAGSEAVIVYNSPLVGTGSTGKWQFKDSNMGVADTPNYLLLTSSLFNGMGDRTSPFTILFNGTLNIQSAGGGTFGTGLFGNPMYSSNPSGSDIIARIDNSPGTGRAFLDFRENGGGNFNRYNIAYTSGSLLNLAFVKDSSQNISVFQNGQLLATTSSAGWTQGFTLFNSSSALSVTSSTGVQFGMVGIQGVTFDSLPYRGQLGAISIYNRALANWEISESAMVYNGINKSVREVDKVYLGSNIVLASPPSPATTTTTTAAPSIPTSGLQLYLNPANGTSWPGSGSTLYDLSVNARNFTLQGSPSFTGSNSFGFNGSNYLNNSSAGLNILSATSSFSIYTFFKPSTAGTVSGVQQVMSKNQSSPNYMGWGVGYNTFTGGGEGRWGLDFIASNGGRINVDTTNAYTSSRFVGNCITYNGNANASGVKLYFNAVSGAVGTTVRANSLTSAGNPQTTAPTNVAGRDNSTNFFSGRVGAVLIYDRELSASEVTEIYNTLSSSFTN